MINQQSTSRWDRFQRKLAPYVFISPFYIFFFIFMVIPILFALYASFTNWAGLEPPQFIGLKNYLDLIKDKTFRLALVNNLWYSGASVFIVVPLALLLATLLDASWLRGREFFRAVYFMPILTSAVVVGIIFLLLYDYRYGLLNWVLDAVGLPTPDWLGAKEWKKPAVIGLIIWRWTGHHMIYFLAGLQSIPQELYEAAMVDGASRFRSLIHITIPLLRPVILFVVVITTIGSFQIFEEPYVLGAEPADSGLSLAMYLYRVGFTYMRQGFGSSVGFALFAIIFALSLIQTRYFGLFREE